MEEFADREALRARFTRTMTTDVAARLKNEERDASYRMSPREEGPQVGETHGHDDRRGEMNEDDVPRRDFGGKLPNTRLGGMQTHLHRVELEPTVELDHDLAIQRGVRRQEITQCSELGEISKQRPLVAAPERELAAVVLEHAAKAVPLRFVLPALAFGKRLHELRLHRRERDVRTRHQSATTAVVLVTSLSQRAISRGDRRCTSFLWRPSFVTSSRRSARIAWTRRNVRKRRSDEGGALCPPHARRRTNDTTCRFAAHHRCVRNGKSTYTIVSARPIRRSITGHGPNPSMIQESSAAHASSV